MVVGLVARLLVNQSHQRFFQRLLAERCHSERVKVDVRRCLALGWLLRQDAGLLRVLVHHGRTQAHRLCVARNDALKHPLQSVARLLRSLRLANRPALRLNPVFHDPYKALEHKVSPVMIIGQLQTALFHELHIECAMQVTTSSLEVQQQRTQIRLCVVVNHLLLRA